MDGITIVYRPSSIVKKGWRISAKFY